MLISQDKYNCCIRLLLFLYVRFGRVTGFWCWKCSKCFINLEQEPQSPNYHWTRGIIVKERAQAPSSAPCTWAHYISMMFGSVLWRPYTAIGSSMRDTNGVLWRHAALEAVQYGDTVYTEAPAPRVPWTGSVHMALRQQHLYRRA